MKRTLLFIVCVLASLAMSAEGINFDNFYYVSFVKGGKQWHLVESGMDQYMVKYMLSNEPVIEEATGKSYFKFYRSVGDMAAVYDVGLVREEDHKVYFYDTDAKKEFLMFDFSLKEGDTYETYSYEYQQMVKYKVWSVEDYTEGPEMIHYIYDQTTDSWIAQRRYLRKWVVSSTLDDELCMAPKVWIEGVGSLGGPLGNFYDVAPVSSISYLAYVDHIHGEVYLPFSFYDTIKGGIHGSDVPKGGRFTNSGNKGDNRLIYELEGRNLHVYGKIFTQCGPNNYAYFYEKSTDDPMVHRIEVEIQEVEPIADCASFESTDFYVPGFDPNMNYIVVDNYGEEHTVIKKTPQIAYRPFVEEGKVWKVGYGSSNPTQLVEYYYFDGDTIIGGKTCKQMMCQRYVTPDHSDYEIIMRYPLLQRSGVWYELDKKVYVYDDTNKKFKIMYDFSVDANDTLQIVEYAPPYVLGPRQTGGMKGFKGVYRDVMTSVEGENHYNITWIEGVGSIEGPKYNVYYGKEYHGGAFLMSCTVGDEVIYFNDEYEDGATPENLGAQKRRFDFTHTTKLQPKVPTRRGEEQTIYAEYNAFQLGVNLEPIDDAYMVRITDETGKVVYDKAINAGSIVGLNIDISNYAKGRYTVTVENSQEVFTGEFEAQATGIEEVNLTPVLSKGEGTIFNLQGQRLSSLQRGLNIVNGQKVYVK